MHIFLFLTWELYIPQGLGVSLEPRMKSISPGKGSTCFLNLLRDPRNESKLDGARLDAFLNTPSKSVHLRAEVGNHVHMQHRSG